MKSNTNGMSTPLGNNSVKTVLWCTIVGFIFVFAYNFFVHGTLLSSTYALTPTLWRPEADMQTHIVYINIMYLIAVYAAADIYARFAQEGGMNEGIRFGLLLGIFLGAHDAMPYAWLPISGTLASYWFVAGFVQGLGLGIVFSLVNRK